MGRIVLVGGTKGGTGKSTIATNLAALRVEKEKNSRVLIVDTDTQGSSLSWYQSRRRNGINTVDCIQVFKNDLKEELGERIDSYDDIIIDCGARDSEELRFSMAISDVMLVPFSVSQFGLETADTVFDIVEEANVKYGINLPCYVFSNNIKSHPSLNEEDESMEFLKQFGLFNIIDTVVHDRIGFTRSNGEGKGVNEILNNRGRLKYRKAVDELIPIYNQVYGI